VGVVWFAVVFDIALTLPRQVKWFPPKLDS